MTTSPFLNHIIEIIQEKRFAKPTIGTYLHWMKFYIHFHHNQHSAQLGVEDVASFLNYLVNKRHVTAQIQASAPNALSFFIGSLLSALWI
ncbi:MAG: hypothetical protein ACI8R9_000678 [Paraglaciecola sp.]|jgi:hypothetical protein